MVTTTHADPKLASREQVRRSLPTVTLEQIRIASPCKVSWDSMAGDEKTRHCGQCDKDVHDLSAMTRAEAEALVNGGQGRRMCVKMWVRKDGTVLTQDCPVGLAKVRRSLRRVGALFGALLGSLGGLLGCTPQEDMGAVVVPTGRATGTPAPIQTTTTTTPEAPPEIEEPREVMGDFCAPAPVDSTSAPGPGSETPVGR